MRLQTDISVGLQIYQIKSSHYMSSLTGDDLVYQPRLVIGSNNIAITNESPNVKKTSNNKKPGLFFSPGIGRIVYGIYF